LFKCNDFELNDTRVDTRQINYILND
jgi:hypothetical protein